MVAVDPATGRQRRACRADVEVAPAVAVAHQATGLDKLAQGIARGQRIASCQRDHLFAMSDHERTGTDEQRAVPALDERCKGGIDVAGARGIENDKVLPQRLRRGLHIPSLGFGFNRIRSHEHRNCCCLGHKLAKQLQPFRP